jgi:hypothetical protein
MEGLDRLVAESLARHGFDRPLDYRRLHWSRWFLCDSPHSLLTVPSKPGVFAIAEEIMPLSDAAEPQAKRMLAVLQFCEDDDMAFVLDRMFSHQNPLRARLASGRCFVRFVVLEEQSQRRSICAALNQWLISSGEKATGIGAHFESSLELPTVPETSTDRVARTLLSVTAEAATKSVRTEVVATETPAETVKPAAALPVSLHPQLDSGASTNIHCPSPFPSGF